ncbi:MAG: hypothetical protein IPP70_02710 [Elusimicrobia bacterium]|nr:hypothetical protein [Elusimicrobiota bacterium]
MDAAVENHMLDLLIYKTDAKMDLRRGRPHGANRGENLPRRGRFRHVPFSQTPAVGTASLADVSGYTMVKTNWFNGVRTPSIVIRRLDGRWDVVRRFDYEDFRGHLS